MTLNMIEKELSARSAALCDIIYRHTVAQDSSTAEVVDALETQADQVEYIEIEACSTEAYLAVVGDTAYLAFRGSESPKDWVLNFLVSLESWPSGGHCHLGFRQALEDSRDTIIPKLDGLTARGVSRIVFTGHSLGGAMALMYVAALKNEKSNLPISHLITFGQPRAGNGNFISWFQTLNVPYLRFVNDGDAVPDVPPPFRKSDWSHAGRKIQFDKSGAAVECEKDDEKSSITRIFNTIIALAQAYSANKANDAFSEAKGSHDIKRYRNNVATLKTQEPLT